MGENSLKVPCLLQGCPWAASQVWMHLCKSALSGLELIWDCQGAEHDAFASLICISPHPPALHMVPVWQERARQKWPLTPAWSCLLPVQQEMLWDLCSSSYKNGSKIEFLKIPFSFAHIGVTLSSPFLLTFIRSGGDDVLNATPDTCYCKEQTPCIPGGLPQAWL